MKSFLAAFLIVAVVAASGCANTKVAQKKSVDVAGHKLEFGGEYQTGRRSLSVTINGDPALAGTFPPYTPTLKLNGQYQGLDVVADCYFGSVLGGRAGIVGIVAGAVQNAHGKGADKCDLQVGGKVLETLYF